jgi:hypothetical protein
MKAYVSHVKQIELTALAKHHHQIGYRRSSEINCKPNSLPLGQ